MSQRQSLAGYLHTKPTGPFRRLKGNQRQWYVFDQTKLKISVYKSEEEAIQVNKEPLRVINIANAVFNIDPSECNQFSISSEGKEYVLQAETEEAMLSWLDALQFRRTALLENDPSSILTEGASQANRLPLANTSLSRYPAFLQQKPASPCYDVNEIHQGSPMLASRSFRKPNIFTFSSTSRDLGTSGPVLRHHKSDTSPHRRPISCAGMPSPEAVTSNRIRPKLHSLREDRPIEISATLESESVKTEDNLVESSLLISTTKPLPDAQRFISLPTKTYFREYSVDSSQEDVDSTNSHIDTCIDNQESMRDQQQQEVDVCHYSLPTSPKTPVSRGKASDESVKSLPINAFIGFDSAYQSPSQQIHFFDNKSSSFNRSDDSLVGQDSVQQTIRDLQAELEASHERENWLRQLLTNRETTMTYLENNLGEMDNSSSDLYIPDGASCAYLRKMVSELDVHKRSMNRKIQFLCKEVCDLAVVRQMLTDHGVKQAKYTKKLSTDVTKWKQDYLKLLESCVGAFHMDASHGLMFSDYGKKRCKEKLTELLEEARRKDPTLPPLKKPVNVEYHIDEYGFKQSYQHETAVMFYVCRHLHSYMNRQLSWEDERITQWTEIMRNPARELSQSELKHLCRAGVPAHIRGGVWRMLIHGEMKQVIDEKGSHYYNRLAGAISESSVATKYRKQISLDILRTMPNNIHFDCSDAAGVQKLQEILQAYSIHNTEIGYCQGMNFLVAVALLFLKKEDAFWCLAAILEKYLPSKYYDSGLIGAQVDQLVLKDLIDHKLPRLARHIKTMEIDISAITLNWFLSVFYDSVPFETLIRIWDVFLLDGSKCLFRISLALFKRNEDMLLLQSDTISFWKCLKAAARLTYDVDALIHTAYEEFRPFFSRRTIDELRAHHFEVLSGEMSEKRNVWRKAVKEVKEENIEDWNILTRRTKKTIDAIYIQAATASGCEHIWIAHGTKTHSVVSKVYVVKDRMIRTGIEMDTDISCMCSLNTGILLIGTLSGKLCAYSTSNCELLWQFPVHETITDLVVAFWPDQRANKLFAGLGNGGLIIIENVGTTEPRDTLFEITIGFTRISSLAVVQNRLWCACGNIIHIFYTATLDYHGQFNISDNALDMILTMQYSKDGVWIAVRGSPVIELRDPRTCDRVLLYNTVSNDYPIVRSEEDQFNIHRITSLLPVENGIWIGRGDGEILTFEIKDKNRVHYHGSLDQAIGRQLLMNRASDNEAFSTGVVQDCSYATYFCNEMIKVDETFDKTYEEGSRVTFGSQIRMEESIGVSKSCEATNDTDFEDGTEKINLFDGKKKEKEAEDEDVVVDRLNGEREKLELGNEVEGRNKEKELETEELDSEEQGREPFRTEDADEIDEEEKNELLRGAYERKASEKESVVQEQMKEEDEEGGLTQFVVTKNPDFQALNTVMTTSAQDATEEQSRQEDREPTDIPSNERTTYEGRSPSSSVFTTDARSVESEETSPIHPSESPMFCPLRRRSCLPESLDEEERATRFKMKLLMKTKVSETPICFLISDGRSGKDAYVVSCATFINDDDAVLKWAHWPAETAMWTNNPVLLYDPQSQQVQLPTYMLNKMRSGAVQRSQSSTFF